MIGVLVLSRFTAALAALVLTWWLCGSAGWCLALLSAGLTLYFTSLLPNAAAGEPETFTYAWVPSLGMHLALCAHGLSLLFTLLISGVEALVMSDTDGYLKGQSQPGTASLLGHEQ